MRSKKHKINLVALLLTGAVFASNPPWFIWGYGAFINMVAILILTCMLFKRFKQIPAKAWILFWVGLIPVFVLYPLTRGAHLSSIAYAILFLLTWIIKPNDYLTTLRYVTKILAWIIIFSLPLWMVYQYIYQFSPWKVTDLAEMKGTEYSVFMYNFFFFVIVSGTEVYRFYSIFDEPGVLGTIAAFILYANKYNFKKWENIVIFIGAFFCFSMAFTVLTILGLIIFNLKSPSRFLKITGVVGILVVTGAIILKENKAFQEGVVFRLMENNVIDLVDDRNDRRVNWAYEESISNGGIVLGMGHNKMAQRDLYVGSSYKLFILEYGLIGTAILFIMYFLMLRGRKDIYSLGILILYIASFAQRPTSFLAGPIIVFACAVASMSQMSKKRNEQPQNYSI